MPYSSTSFTHPVTVAKIKAAMVQATQRPTGSAWVWNAHGAPVLKVAYWPGWDEPFTFYSAKRDHDGMRIDVTGHVVVGLRRFHAGQNKITFETGDHEQH